MYPPPLDVDPFNPCILAHASPSTRGPSLPSTARVCGVDAPPYTAPRSYSDFARALAGEEAALVAAEASRDVEGAAR